MKKVLTAVWKFINSKFLGYAIAIIIIMFLAGQCRRNTDLARENQIHEQNLAAADSTINEYVNKEGTYTAEKAVWILTEKQLKEQNRDLYDRVKAQGGKIISLNRTVLQLKQDTAILHDSIRYLIVESEKPEYLGKGEWKLPWKLSYDWAQNNFQSDFDKFSGHTWIKVDTASGKILDHETLFDERLSRIDLEFGEKVVDGKYNVFVRSKYPGLTTESLEGYFIDPNESKAIKQLIKKKHWFTGFSISIGITPGYDFIHGQPTIVIGPSIGYTIYQW